MDEEAGLAGADGEGSTPTVAALCAAWLAFQREQVQPSTWWSYDDQLRRWVLPVLGKVALDELSAGLLTSTWAQLLDHGGAGGGQLSIASVRRLYGVLHTALEWGVDQRLLEANPARKSRAPRIDPHSDRVEESFTVWTPAQVASFLAQTTGHSLWLVCLVAVSTGMRRGEILGLRWEDVDLDRAEVHVCRSLAVAGERLILKQPKTSRTRRICIDTRVVAALRAWRERQHLLQRAPRAEWTDRWGLAVTARSGRPVHPSTVSSQFPKLLRRLDLPRIRFHDYADVGTTTICGIPTPAFCCRRGLRPTWWPSGWGTPSRR